MYRKADKIAGCRRTTTWKARVWLLVALAVLGGFVSCGTEPMTAAPGALVIVVDTDLSTPKDIDRVRVEVVGGQQMLLDEKRDFATGNLVLPADFRVAATGDSTAAVVRAVAFKNGLPRIERSAITTIPSDQVGWLRLPLSYLCDGTATSEGTSTCGEGQTCILGACGSASVPPTDVPPYSGGGDAGTNCFDVPTCFADAPTFDPEPVSCSIASPMQTRPNRLNVALQLPSGSEGLCGMHACWIVLDQGSEGWELDGSRIRLPENACHPRADGHVAPIAISTACDTKTAALARCADHSRAGQSVGSPPVPPPPLGDACSGPPSRACGNCGTQTRKCENGTWSSWSACVGEGPCAPKATGACGDGGTVICGDNCQWSPCAGFICPGPSMQACGNCGMQSRGCDGATGNWSDWSACVNEGICKPNDTRSCGTAGGQTCTAKCDWGSCLTIVVTPPNASIPAGKTQSFTAMGYSDGVNTTLTDQVTWSSSDTVATVDNTAGSKGLAKGVRSGTSTISASLGGAVGKAQLTITAAELVSISITPPNPSIGAGKSVQLTAMGNYTDGSTRDVTSNTKWSSSDTGVATVSATGMLIGVQPGSARITADSAMANGSTNVTVNGPLIASIAVSPPNTSVAKGRTKQYTAIASYSDGSTGDVTTTALWSSSNLTAATIVPMGLSGGLASAIGVGGTTIGARLGSVFGSTGLTVTPAVPTSVTVSPTNPTIRVGNSLQFKAVVTFSDGTMQDMTTQVTWQSNNVLAATIGNTGLATGVGSGSSTISATISGIPGNTNLSVTP